MKSVIRSKKYIKAWCFKNSFKRSITNIYFVELHIVYMLQNVCISQLLLIRMSLFR